MSPEQIAECYDNESPDTARTRILPLAEAGNAVAQFYMGHLCDLESPPNQLQAAIWYRKAADQSHLEALHYLASFMYYGMGVDQNVDLALQLFRRAAEAGLDSSQWRLGMHLSTDESSRAEGIVWLQRAANQGHEGAVEALERLRGET